jgi:hypothetical protein
MLMTTEVDRHRLLLFTLKGVAFDELGELALGHVRLRRPGALRQLPVEQACRAPAAEHQARIGECHFQNYVAQEVYPKPVDRSGEKERGVPSWLLTTRDG